MLMRLLFALMGKPAAVVGTPSGQAIFEPNIVGSLRVPEDWTVPAGVTSICVLCIGAGGGVKRKTSRLCFSGGVERRKHSRKKHKSTTIPSSSLFCLRARARALWPCRAPCASFCVF